MDPETPDAELASLFEWGHRLEPVVADTKGVATPVWKLKKKLMKACLGIDVVEL